jgi:hypothetical protein
MADGVIAVLVLVVLAVPPAIAAATDGRSLVADRDPGQPAIHEDDWERVPGMLPVLPVAGPGASAEPADPSPGSAADTSGDPGWGWVPSFSFALILAATGVLFFAAARARRSRPRS